MSGVVVYIDDEPAICRIVAYRLEAQGLPTQTFTDPEAAIDYVGRKDVRCVLCDYQMPTMSGLEVLERIGTEVPFYLVTGDLYLEDRVGHHRGLRGVIHKPLRFDELVDRIRDPG